MARKALRQAGNADQCVELFAVRYVDATEPRRGIRHDACAFGDGSAREAPAEPRAGPSAKAFQVTVTGEHEGDATLVRKEQHLGCCLAAGLLGKVACGVDRAEARIAHRPPKATHPAVDVGCRGAWTEPWRSAGNPVRYCMWRENPTPKRTHRWYAGQHRRSKCHRR